MEDSKGTPKSSPRSATADPVVDHEEITLTLDEPKVEKVDSDGQIDDNEDAEALDKDKADANQEKTKKKKKKSKRF